MLEMFRQASPETTYRDRRKLRQFVSSQIVFLLVSPVILQFLGRFTVETYFIIAYVWFLLMSEVLVPRTHEAKWWWWIQWTKVAGLLMFAYISTQHIASVIQ